CVAGKALLTVQVTNNDAVPVKLMIDSAYGSKTIATVAPTKNGSHAFTTRLASLPAGEVTVTASATVDGQPVSTVVPAPYEAKPCG
ncbi:hypothetical protein, partial [Agreia bicolorata]